MISRCAVPAALALAAGLALSACSSGADGAAPAPSASAAPPTASPAAPPSPSATGSGAQVVADFCTARNGQLADLSRQLQSSGPEQLPVIVPQVVAALDAVQPPAEVAADYAAFRDGMAALSDAVEGADPSSPDVQARVVAVGQQHAQQMSTADGRLSAWAQANCPAPG